MSTLEAIHIDTTSKSAVVRATFTYPRACVTSKRDIGAERQCRVNVNWTMDHVSLYRMRQMITAAPGVFVPVVRVAGSLTSEGSKAYLAAVRMRPVIDWTGGAPKIDGVQVEFVDNNASDEHLADGYATLGLHLKTAAWTQLHRSFEAAIVEAFGH